MLSMSMKLSNSGIDNKRVKDETKIYTIIAVADRPARRSHRNDLAIYSAVGGGTENSPNCIGFCRKV